MRRPDEKKSSYGKAFIVLGIGAGVGLGLCGFGFGADPSSESGFLHSAATAAISLGIFLFWGSLLGVTILSVIWVLIAISKVNRK
jgi:hypothetical protein